MKTRDSILLDIDSISEEPIHTFLVEIKIEPHQIGKYKIHFHQEVINTWLQSRNIPLDLETVWRIREEYIQSLANN